MKKIFFLIPVFAILIFSTSCKSKMEKKDKSLTEMQSDSGGHYEPKLPGADVRIYKTIDTTNLCVNIFYPEGHVTTDHTPCIIFFFAGAFIQGSPSQYLEHCKYFASRGIVSISADYRVISRNNTTANECVYDAKSCIRWVREHAADLGIDGDKIIVAGGSAGGMLAITSAINDPAFQDATDNASVSCVPNAMVLFNPVVNALEFPFRIQKFKTDPKAPKAETSRAKDVDPLTHIKSGMPPAIMFHGTADKMSAFKYAQDFADKMNAMGNAVEFHKYDGMEHGFTQPDRHDGKYYKESMKLTDDWLVKLGYLTGSATI